MASEIPSLLLNDGNRMPMAGLGVYKTSGDFEMQQALNAALDAGCRLIDTASVYKNEENVGHAVASCGIPREELFITTKVWNTAQRIGDIEGALERSLERLGSDYADLYLIHWPVPGCYPATWEKLIRLREAGMVRSIGGSNFDIPQRFPGGYCLRYHLFSSSFFTRCISWLTASAADFPSNRISLTLWIMGTST